MHYKNGRAAKNGDKILHIGYGGTPTAGILYDAVAGNDYCNGKIATISINDPCPNLKECLHIEDVIEMETFYKNYRKHEELPVENK